MPYTKAANAHVGAMRKDTEREATWFDVAAAYDAGLLHGANRTRDARDQLTELGHVTRDHRGGIHCSCSDCRRVTDTQIL